MITLVIAIAAALNSVFSFITKDVVKKHSLTIHVADMKAVDNRVSYVIAFTNNGDFPEIVTDAESFLGQYIKGYNNPLIIPQRYCFNPFVVEANNHKVITYETKYDISDSDLKLLSAEPQKFVPMVKFSVRGEEQGLITKYVKLGVLKPPHYDFLTQSVELDFEDPRPHLITGPFPVEKQYSNPSLCKG